VLPECGVEVMNHDCYEVSYDPHANESDTDATTKRHVFREAADEKGFDDIAGTL
jgi:hypothetical protein